MSFLPFGGPQAHGHSGEASDTEDTEKDFLICNCQFSIANQAMEKAVGNWKSTNKSAKQFGQFLRAIHENIGWGFAKGMGGEAVGHAAGP